jgi:hypothetical protein
LNIKLRFRTVSGPKSRVPCGIDAFIFAMSALLLLLRVIFLRVLFQ